MGQCIRLHGLGTNGLQLHRQCQNPWRQSLEIRSHLRASRHRVGSPTRKLNWSHINNLLTAIQLFPRSSCRSFNGLWEQSDPGPDLSRQATDHYKMSKTSQLTVEKGLHIYMGGVGLQELFIIFFVGLAINFQRQIKRETPMQDQPRVMRLLFVLYAVLTLITVSRPRSSTLKGPHSPLTHHPSRSVSFSA